MQKIIIYFFIFFTFSNYAQTKEEYFRTLLYDKVNLRQGPSKDYPIKLFYKKKFLPVLPQVYNINSHKLKKSRSKDIRNSQPRTHHWLMHFSKPLSPNYPGWPKLGWSGSKSSKVVFELAIAVSPFIVKVLYFEVKIAYVERAIVEHQRSPLWGAVVQQKVEAI